MDRNRHLARWEQAMGSPPTRRGGDGPSLQAAMEGLARIDHALQHGNVLIGYLSIQMQPLAHAIAGSLCNRWISVQYRQAFPGATL